MKVLIVDDNDTNRKLLRINLDGEGVQTCEAEDGIQALSILDKEKVDAIISDILMPKMDGYRLCQEVRKCSWLADIPFIFYTSTYTSPGDEKLALDCGADRYIKKPAPLSTMLMALLELVNPEIPRLHPDAPPEEMVVMREYNEALVRKLEERNAKLERARAEIMRANAQLERRVQERTAELLAANQELEAFAHSIAHDLRSPLMAIDGFSHILVKECEGRVTAKAMEHLHFISRATHRMNELTTDLLRLSRASRAVIRRESIDLSVLASAIVQELREAHPDRDTMVKIAPGIRVNADVALLRIALENLLSNAWKFTARTPGATIEVGTMDDEGGRAIFVRDNGAGFDMDAASKLFSPFERLHPVTEYPGTGIGLTTVQRIVARHGGSIRAVAEVGKGATFSFDLGPGEDHSRANGEGGGL
jgi:signal transduction histidine kinase